jgi:hypothetical protein
MSAEIKKSCFPIIVRNQSKEIIDRGTGFFINAAGYFITSGQVVVDPTCSYYALIEKELPMDIKFKEYVDQQAYRSNLYMDLAFGKIEHQPIDIMKFSAERLEPGQSVVLNGFENDFNSYTSQINDIPAEKTNKITKELFVMTNVYTIAGMDQAIKGMRGGPIMHENACCAIVSNATEGLTSLYITEQLEAAGVEFALV